MSSLERRPAQHPQLELSPKNQEKPKPQRDLGAQLEANKNSGSILSFPDRGRWGDACYPGNCSGYIYQTLFKHLQPRVFTDPMVGSGTSVEVAREMGIEAHGLDLHSGFNILTDSILQAVGKPSDLVFSHPPYHNMVIYSGRVWAKEPHPDDLSRCSTEEDFIEKLNRALANQRDATKLGGFYGLLIGDVRRSGRYSSYQADILACMPRQELRAVLIKAQHNVRSDQVRYERLSLPRIQHEYILLWQKLSDPAKQVENLPAGRQGRRIPTTKPEGEAGDRFASLTSSDLFEAEQDSVTRLAIEVLADRYKVGTVLTSPDSVREYLQLKLSERKVENFGAVFLDNRHRVLAFDEMFQGTIDGAQVHPRVVVQRALEANAAALILYHNHPSGVAEPSRADEAITKRLKEALSLVDIRVLDHFVVGAEAVTSFAERGLL